MPPATTATANTRKAFSQVKGPGRLPPEASISDWVVYYDVQSKSKKFTSKEDFLQLLTEAGRCKDSQGLELVLSKTKVDDTDATKVNLRVFRAGVQPIWEDPANITGGSAMWRFSKKQSAAKLLSAVMRFLNSSKSVDSVKINGVVLSTRRRWGHLLSIWMSVPPSERLEKELSQWMKSFDPKFVCFQSETKGARSRNPSELLSPTDLATDSDVLSAASTPDANSQHMFQPLGAEQSKKPSKCPWANVQTTVKAHSIAEEYAALKSQSEADSESKIDEPVTPVYCSLASMMF
jgi:translation initiation factor 4E